LVYISQFWYVAPRTLATLDLAGKGRQLKRFSQGDQIGRIFAHGVIVYFGQLFETDKSSPHVSAAFFQGHGHAFNIDEN
jgi:hypothetical protein